MEARSQRLPNMAITSRCLTPGLPCDNSAQDVLSREERLSSRPGNPPQGSRRRKSRSFSSGAFARLAGFAAYPPSRDCERLSGFRCDARPEIVENETVEQRGCLDDLAAAHFEQPKIGVFVGLAVT